MHFPFNDNYCGNKMLELLPWRLLLHSICNMCSYDLYLICLHLSSGTYAPLPHTHYHIRTCLQVPHTLRSVHSYISGTSPLSMLHVHIPHVTPSHLISSGLMLLIGLNLNGWQVSLCCEPITYVLLSTDGGCFGKMYRAS